MDFAALAQACAPQVEPQLIAAVVRRESSFNPFAIGVVDGFLERQPRNLPEAIATAESLQAGGWNFSLGLAQINKTNLKAYGLTFQSAFDVCSNLSAGASILTQCYQRAQSALAGAEAIKRAALSCYYSGNFQTGQLVEADGTSYVQRVLADQQGGQVTHATPIAVHSSKPKAKAVVQPRASASSFVERSPATGNSSVVVF